MIRHACAAFAATLFALLPCGVAQAFEPGDPYFRANDHAYDGTYKFAVPCGLRFTIGLEMRIYPSSYPYFPDPDRPVQWSGDLPSDDPDAEYPGCNPTYGSSSISVLYLTPGAKHLHAEVQKYMGEEQGYLTWEGNFTVYVVRVESQWNRVIRSRRRVYYL